MTSSPEILHVLKIYVKTTIVKMFIFVAYLSNELGENQICFSIFPDEDRWSKYPNRK